MVHTLIAVVFLALMSLATSASAQEDRPWNLVCFNKAGLEMVLSRIVNAQQFLNNSMGQTVFRNEMTKAGCDYAQVPAGSSAVSAGFYNSGRFIFPMFRVQFSTTGQNMYSADGIFDEKQWTLFSENRVDSGYGHHKQEGRGWGSRLPPVLVVQKLLPKSCDVLEGYMHLSGGFLPNYMLIPPGCQRQIIR